MTFESADKARFGASFEWPLTAAWPGNAILVRAPITL